MPVITETKFKQQCSKYMLKVNKTSKPLTITKHGKPLVEVIPYSESFFNSNDPLNGVILMENDIVSPLENDWEANK